MYVKTQWVNNTTPINDTNLNKIEQGIYDNSLVVDAVTNTLNPTDTETYKTAELTEGQITDVIGVNDIVIKGQTEQDGTPTPSAPVDVNVVSGSNIVYTSNKNLLSFPNIENTNNGITYKISNGILKLSGTATGAIAINSPIFNLAAGTYMFTRNISGNLNGSWQTYIRDVTTGDSSLVAGNGNFTITETKQVQFRLFMNSGVNGTDITFYPMLEVGSTATTYEPHQGKELPLDLGSIELCKIGDYQDYFYKSGSKWYLHKEIGKVVLDGITQGKRLIIKHSSITSETKGFYQFNIADKIAGTNGATNLGISNYFKFVGSNAQNAFNNNTSGIWWENTRSFYFILEETTVKDANNWLDTHNTTIYYVLETATNTEITGILKEQLEAIYNAPLYEQTNITQTNNDLPMVLDITACKDNINGIKAFIRK